MGATQNHPAAESVSLIENPHGKVGVTVFIEKLVVGQIYAFQIKDWEPPAGDKIPGELQTRKFLGLDDRGSEIGEWPTTFLSVERPDGTKRRIAAHTIATALPVSKF